MIYRYELACRESGLSEERIAQIRQVFDNDQKKLKRMNEQIAKNNVILVFSADSGLAAENGEACDLQIEDPNVNVEEQCIHNLDLELLGVALQPLDEDDREFLMECFNGEYDCIKRLAEKYGVTKKSIICRREKLVNRLRKEFFAEH